MFESNLSKLARLQNTLDMKFRTSEYRLKSYLLTQVGEAFYTKSFNNLARPIVRDDGNIICGAKDLIKFFISMDEDKMHCSLDTFTEELAKKWLCKWLDYNKPGYTYETSNIDKGYLSIAIGVPKKFECRSEYIFNSESDPIMGITLDAISSKLTEYISDEETDSFSFDSKIEFAVFKDNKELNDAIADGIPGGISGLISNEINSVIDGYAIIVSHRLTETHLDIEVYGQRTNQNDYVPKFTATEMVNGIGNPQMAMDEPKVDNHENEEPAEPVKQEALSLIGKDEEEKPFNKTIEEVCRECHVSKDAVKKHMMTHRVSLETAYKYYSSTTYAKRGTGTAVKVNGKFFATIGEACDITGIPYYKVKKVHDETGLPYSECFEKIIDDENNVTEEEYGYTPGGPAIPVEFSDGTKFASKTEMIKSLDVSWSTFLKWQRKEGWTDEEAYRAFKDGVVDGLRTPPGSYRKKEIVLSDGRVFDSVTSMLKSANFTSAQLYEVMAKYDVGHAEAFEFLESESEN